MSISSQTVLNLISFLSDDGSLVTVEAVDEVLLDKVNRSGVDLRVILSHGLEEMLNLVPLLVLGVELDECSEEVGADGSRILSHPSLEPDSEANNLLGVSLVLKLEKESSDLRATIRGQRLIAE